MKVVSSLYYHMAYKAARANQYLIKCTQSGSAFKPDRNDYEDGSILLHLELAERNILVTNDQGTIDAIRCAKEAFDWFFEGRCILESSALTAEEFINEFAAP